VANELARHVSWAREVSARGMLDFCAKAQLLYGILAPSFRRAVWNLRGLFPVGRSAEGGFADQSAAAAHETAGDPAGTSGGSCHP
jgi:hypothetical protein